LVALIQTQRLCAERKGLFSVTADFCVPKGRVFYTKFQKKAQKQARKKLFEKKKKFFEKVVKNALLF